MNAKIQKIETVLEQIKNQAGDLLGLERVEYDSNTQRMELFFMTQKHLSPVKYRKLTEQVQTQPDCCVHVSQHRFFEELKQCAPRYLKDFSILCSPAILPFVQNAHIEWPEQSRVEIAFDNEIGMELFAQMQLADKWREYVSAAYGVDCRVKLTVSQGAHAAQDYAPGKALEQHLNERPKATPPQRAQRQSAEIPPWEAPLPEDVPPEFAPEAPPEEMVAKEPKRPRAAAKPRGKQYITSQICDLKLGDNVMIEGEVVYTEDRELKDGEMTKHKFVVCDYTASITCFFIVSQKYKSSLQPPKKGQWVVVAGTYNEDTFERENTIKVKDIAPSNHKARADHAEEKRVELHMHTQMSSQDGVSDVREIIARAAKWGHPAIAITDHGVVQAFPDAANAAHKHGIKVIYGVEAYMIDDGKKIYTASQPCSFADEFVVFDIETTGLSHVANEITEIGAVRIKNGEEVERFHTMVRPSVPIPPRIIQLTGITDDMVRDAPLPQEALAAFRTFVGENAVLVAHNADFDTKFIFYHGRQHDIVFQNRVVDSVALCRLAYPMLKSHKLNKVAEHLHLPLNHHRADNDAQCTAKIMLACFGEFEKLGAHDLFGVNRLYNEKHGVDKSAKQYHIILLCKTKRGLRNLYKLISHAHLDYFYRKPRMPKSLIEEHREGIIIGSACEAGELFCAMLDDANDERLKKIASFYDYLEIQPLCNNEFMIAKQMVTGEEQLKAFNRKVVQLGEELGKPVVATCDAHYIDPHEEYYRRILFHVQGYDDVSESKLFLRTTDEMLEEFAYLGAEKAYEVVVTNTNAIAQQTEEIELFQSDTAMPAIEGAAEKITELAYQTAKEKYGDPLPEIVEARLKRELDSIVGHGFSVLYYSAHRLVKKSNEDGYLVGSRGSVGSSLAATMTGITEVNPLSPHYLCPQCKHSDFDVDVEQYGCGADLPDADCPKCGTKMIKDGYDIPFEVFLGINADKVPDIDLNFSGAYQSTAHKYTEVLFGKEYVYRAGTISTVKDKIAYGYVKKYFDMTGKPHNEAEVNRLVQGISGVKKTTGQHPGGIVIVPGDREIYEFTPVQKPADSVDAETVTTHFDFNSMHDILIKLDILGHDVPTIIRILQDITGRDPLTIPLDDPDTMKLFSGLEPLGLKSAQLLGIQTGTLGIPEFGTKFVRQMLMETMPSTMSEIVRISGLSHGTDVWIGNAQELIKNGTCTLKQAICTRDDIMNYLVHKGVEKRTAFFIMENVRKGKIAKGGFSESDEKALADANIEQWFIDSCKKIKYMFPKAHAVAYVIMAYRIAYCKVHHPEAFYASYFTVRSGEFDASYVLGGLEDIKKNWQMIENKGNNATGLEKNMGTMLEVACEMYLRGIHFLPVDLQKSDAEKFLVETDGLRLPFLSVPKLGGNAAQNIVVEREKSPFISIEDLKKRAKIGSAVIEEMQKMGTLTGMPQSNQLSLFDF